jgi:uncharacterized iron-regulated membrane protein
MKGKRPVASCDTLLNGKEENGSEVSWSGQVPTKVLRFVRRLHMYLGIALVPWFFMYAIGGFVLNHRALVDGWFRQENPPQTILFEREFHRPLPSQAERDAQPDAMRSFALEILRENGLSSRPFWFNQPNDSQLNINTVKFLKPTSVVYYIDQGRLVGMEPPFNAPHFFIGMHERGGFGPSWLTKVWGGIVDLVGLSVLTWVVSGVYIWWKTRQRRLAGGLVLAAGVVCFAILVAAL